jgi:hypothetical protein
MLPGVADARARRGDDKYRLDGRCIRFRAIRLRRGEGGVIHLTQSLNTGQNAASGELRLSCITHPLARQQSREEKKAGRIAPAPQSLMKPEVIAAVVLKFIEDDTQAGQVIEVRPSGPRVVEARRAPGQRG